MVAGAFGLMLILNVMVGLEFEESKVLPSFTLKELGNKAYADGESTQCNFGSRCTFGNYIYCEEGGTGDSCVCYNCD